MLCYSPVIKIISSIFCRIIFSILVKFPDKCMAPMKSKLSPSNVLQNVYVMYENIIKKNYQTSIEVLNINEQRA